MSLTRRSRFALAIAGVVTALPLTAIIVVPNVDWNRAKPWLNARTSDALGRPFAIRGDLSLTWDKAGTGLRQGGWRDIVPWPHLVARDVHLGNPVTLTMPDDSAPAQQDKTAKPAKADRSGEPGASPPSPPPLAAADMGSVNELSFSLDPFALLEKKISIPLLRFDAPRIALQRRADGSNNWTFARKDKPSPWELDLQKIAFSKGQARLVDAQQHADVTADIDTIEADPRYGVRWKLRGSYNGEAVSGSGKAGAVLSLHTQAEPYPVLADIKAGSTAIAVEGTLTRPTRLAALDMRLKVSGVSMARLYPLTGLVLPDTPPFSTEGHLSGTLGPDGGHWKYEKFTGRVGSSDIAGQLAFETRQPRGLLTGAVSSRLLQFSDLGPLVGADSNASKSARGAAAQPAGRVLPVEAFRTERWTSIDADVQYRAGRIVRGKKLPISNVTTHVILKDGILSLNPLNFDIAGGKMTSKIRLDGSGKLDRHAIRAELTASARHLKLPLMFPTLKALRASVGEVNGDARLTATGNSVASLLGASNGELKTLIDQGTVSKLLLEEMGLNVGNIVLAKLFGDKQVQLNCLAADFVVHNGLMRTRSFVVDTDEAMIDIDGTVNLANEQLDLTLKPDTKGFRIFSLRAPLYVRGPFRKPNVSVDQGVLALRAGGAVALAAVAPFAALLPLVNSGPGQDSGCAALLANARIAPAAPPPGKSMPRAAAAKR